MLLLMDQDEKFWRKCSSCKTEIGYSRKFFECSVSTCTRPRTGYVFCSITCFERHLPGAKHRSAGAIERMSPTFAQWKTQLLASDDSEGDGNSDLSNYPSQPVRRIVSVANKQPQEAGEILVVVSKLKAYIKAKSDYNTSEGCMQVLSDYLRQICDEAILCARAEGRRTVMDRDFEKVIEGGDK